VPPPAAVPSAPAAATHNPQQSEFKFEFPRENQVERCVAVADTCTAHNTVTRRDPRVTTLWSRTSGPHPHAPPSLQRVRFHYSNARHTKLFNQRTCPSSRSAAATTDLLRPGIVTTAKHGGAPSAPTTVVSIAAMPNLFSFLDHSLDLTRSVQENTKTRTDATDAALTRT
jgi:hypothetical protein